MNKDDRNDAEAILKMTVIALRDKLRGLGLGVSGRKYELRERLLQHFGLIDDGDDDDDCESNQSVSELDESAPLAHVSSAHFTFKDIQESLSTFDGTDGSDVHKWIEQLEENATIVNWNEIHKFIYAKQLLRGAAKIFILSQIGLRDWDALKLALTKEFGAQLSAADVHKMLGRRKKTNNESYREYLYALMEIGKSINLDEKSLLEYFIDGIPGSKFNKAVLYQAKSISELKEQLVIYEKINQEPRMDNFKKTEANSKIKRENANSIVRPISEKRCYKCGELSHLARDCSSKQFKCFKCQQMGHRSFERKVSRGSTIKQENGNVNSIGDNENPKLKFKTLIICNVEMSALVDTGCNLCLMRCDLFNKLDKALQISPEQRQLFGIGSSKISTLGSFKTEVQIDENVVNLTFHIVKQDDISYDVILGNSICKYFDVIVREEGVDFKKKIAVTAEDELKTKKIIQTNIVEATSTDDLMVNIFSNQCLNIEHNECEYDLTHLNERTANVVQNLIKQYKPMRNDNSPVYMKIILSDEVPVYQHPRRVSYEEQRVIDNQVTQWLEEGIVRPSCSSYASPVVLVSKRDGTKRLCCDYRKLNSKIIRDNFPMTLIDDALERLRGAKVFTTLDLVNGFFHVPIEEGSRKYTAFVTKSGQFEFQYVPFGLCNSPAVFCRYIHAILKDFIRDGTVVAYMDDLVIPAKSENEALEKLERVLEFAAEKGIRIKWKKCQFLKKRIEFLGYVVENETIKPSDEKTKAVKNFPLPQTKKALQRFLGLMSYFRRFIKNYALIAKPLSDMLKKDAKFRINDEQFLSFKQLKTALIQAPVLALFNPKAMTEIHTDASMYGYGAILLQRNSEDEHFHPVQFMSRKTSPAEEKYHSYELEVLAIIQALRSGEFMCWAPSSKSLRTVTLLQ